MTSQTVFNFGQLGPLDACGRWCAEGWRGGSGPLDDRLLGNIGGPRWSVGQWWAIKSDQQLKKKNLTWRY